MKHGTNTLHVAFIFLFSIISITILGNIAQPTNRKILRLVKHTLASVSGVRDQEMALLDEMLATCVREASNKSLEIIFSSHLFYQNRQERFVCSLAGEFLSSAIL